MLRICKNQNLGIWCLVRRRGYDVRGVLITQKRMIPKCSNWCREWPWVILQVVWFWVEKSKIKVRVNNFTVIRRECLLVHSVRRVYVSLLFTPHDVWLTGIKFNDAESDVKHSQQSNIGLNTSCEQHGVANFLLLHSPIMGKATQATVNVHRITCD